MNIEWKLLVGGGDPFRSLSSIHAYEGPRRCGQSSCLRIHADRMLQEASGIARRLLEVTATIDRRIERERKRGQDKKEPEFFFEWSLIP